MDLWFELLQKSVRLMLLEGVFPVFVLILFVLFVFFDVYGIPKSVLSVLSVRLPPHRSIQSAPQRSQKDTNFLQK